jgi:hypothetical protein
MFFVNFVPGRGTLVLLRAHAQLGLQKIPVSMDASPFEAFTVAVKTNKRRKW